jgi:uncharacterized protein YjaZ
VWGGEMGIIRTDHWLEEEFEHPVKICEKLMPFFSGQNASRIYQQLTGFGMYRPSRVTNETFIKMKENKVWEEVERISQAYTKKWAGPDVPIYLFPIGQERNIFFRQEEKVKGGVSYPDKMFLFLSNNLTIGEVEALFVHEYHHICRLSKQKKKFEEYTLLDSIIIEGLAEYTVYVHCGKKYLAEWCTMYSETELKKLFDKYLGDNLELKKSEKKHDDLLYGSGRIPKLLGYAAGFKIVENYYKNNHYSTKHSFTLPAKSFFQSENSFTLKKPKK